MIKKWVNQNFKVSRWAGELANVHCPVHNDSTASAAVFTESQWFYCHVCGGMSLSELESKTGIEPHPWDRKTQTPGAVYNYTDETGKVLYYKERYYKGQEKTFKAFNSHGVPTLKGVRRVLYNLKELIYALENSKSVFVVEGEKDVESLKSRGFVATTSDGGAAKEWATEYFEVFPKGSTVYLIPDYDSIGFEYMRKVSTGLKARGCVVKWIELPYPMESKKDISDYFIDHRDITLFHDLISKAKIKTDSNFPLMRPSDFTLEDPEWLIKGMFEADSLATIYGPSGSGKSFISLDMSLCLATGLQWHGKDVKQSPVVYLAGEGHRGIVRRLRAWEKSHGVRVSDNWFLSKKSFQLTDDLSVSSVINSINETTQGVKPRMVVIDTLARNFGAGDENQTKDMNMVIQQADRIRSEFDCLVIIVHHSGKSENATARGSSALRGAMDYEYHVQQNEETGQILFTNKKMKDGEKPKDMAFELVDIDLDHITREGEVLTSAYIEQIELPEEMQKKEKKKTLKAFVMSTLSAYGGRIERTLFLKKCTLDAMQHGWKSPNFRREISALIHEGNIVEDKNAGTLCAIEHCLY